MEVFGEASWFLKNKSKVRGDFFIRFPLKLAENDDVGDLRVINARKKAFSVVPKASSRRPNHVTICLLRHSGVAAKWPTRTPKTKLILKLMPERPTRIQPYQSEPVRQDFERVLEHRVGFEVNPMRYSMGFAKSHSLKCSLHKWA